MRLFWCLPLLIFTLSSQCILQSATTSNLQFLNGNGPIVDAHNCYPYDGRWTDRIRRALASGFPVSIEQDLAWYVDPSTGKGRAVLSHSSRPNPSDPELRTYFFKTVRPIVEKALAGGDSSRWPFIILHFDFKDVQPPLLRAVWGILGQYQDWIATAVKSPDRHELTPLSRKPILVITEDSDAQEKVFYDEVPTGALLRVFGSAHTNMPGTRDKKQLVHLAATLAPETLLTDPPTTYLRWWNNSWHEVEEGGQPKAGDWTSADMARLRSLVDRAHSLGYWIRFYTLDGFAPEEGKTNGWFEDYNFGSLQAAKIRWRAAMQAGVNFIATDQYEALSEFMKESTR
jgi:hypothetical protein